MRPALFMLVSCFASASLAQPAGPPIRKKEIDACNALTGAGKYAKSAACIERLAKTANDPETRMLFYARLTSALYQKQDDQAQALVADMIKSVADRPDTFEAWLHNASNWVAWTRGDLDAAVNETEGMLQAGRKKRMSPEEGRALMLHYAWDRAYLMLDRALAKLADAPDRSALVATAEAARADYHKVADPTEDSDGLACLDAYFALRLGRGNEARDTAKKVDVVHDSDLQDLYVVALAYEAGGDRKGAEALRRKIRAAKIVYPMKPIILRALDRDKAKSPIGK